MKGGNGEHGQIRTKGVCISVKEGNPEGFGHASGKTQR